MEKIIDGKELANMKFIKTKDGLLKEYKPQGRFIPKLGERYYFMTNKGEIDFYDNDNYDIDDYIINHNIVFKTIEDGKDYRWFLEQLDKYKTDFSKEEWKDKDIEKYYIFYDYSKRKVKIEYHLFWRLQGTVHFTKENIEKFIDTVGEDRIKKYMFNVWE